MVCLKNISTIGFQADVNWSVYLPIGPVKITSQVLGVYIYQDTCFGIANLYKKNGWSIIHLPSKTAIVVGLRRKKDAEKVLSYLDRYLDLKSIFLLTPKYYQVKHILRGAIVKAYNFFAYERSRRK